MASDRPATRLATRLAFLVAGFGVACWAPLVPFAKARLGVDDAVLGALLLCVGLGSVIAMLITGPLGTRYGSRPIIVAGGVALAAILPLLSVANTTPALGFALLAFGAALGSLDVAMNVHAIEVEHAAARPLMSGFHALFSVGGIAGSSVMTFLLSMRVGAFASTLLCSPRSSSPAPGCCAPRGRPPGRGSRCRAASCRCSRCSPRSRSSPKARCSTGARC